MKIKITLILSAVILCRMAVADIYVDNKNGLDSNAGKSPDKAVKNLSTAVTLMQKSNDRRLVLANTGSPYYESLMFMDFSGTPDKPLTIEGNGSVLSGLKEIPADKWQVHKNGIWFYPQKRYGALCPYLVIDGKRVPAKAFEKLSAFSHYWSRSGVFFKPENGKSIKDYRIFATVLTSGFTVNNSSYITCRNLTCEYFSNDGFNVHGDSQGLFFQNIVGRYNGDDGFSIHEDVGAAVRGGQFYGNNYGIQDVNAARSEYYGVIVTKNRRAGIHLLGGVHTIVNSVVMDNKWTQIQLESDYAAHLGFTKDNPHFAGTFYLKNLWVANGPTGIKVIENAAVTLNNTVVTDCATGIVYAGNGAFHIYNSVIQNSQEAELDISGSNFHFDFNNYYPGNMVLNKKKYAPNQFEKWKTATKSDTASSIATLKLSEKDSPQKRIQLKSVNSKNTVTAGLAAP